MHHFLYRLSAVVVLLTLSFCVSASAREPSTAIHYAVRAILPANQLNPEVSYFDLEVKPGDEQILQVIVKNKSNEEIEVALEANTAFSNENGVIEFSYTQERDPSMTVDFAALVTPLEPVVRVPAHGQTVAEFTLTLPEEPFQGQVFGGLMFTKLHQNDLETANGMTIRNVYRYLIGVRLRESSEPVDPAFELVGAECVEDDLQSFLLHLRNPVPLIARGMALGVSLSPEDGGETIAFQRGDVGMAPNSAMAYKVRLGRGQSLTPGTYRVLVDIQFEERSWQFETTLTVHERP